MTPIAVIEFTMAGVFIILIGTRLFGHSDSLSLGRLKTAFLINQLWLLIDALSYTIKGPSYPFALEYILNILTYAMGSIVMIGYLRYADAYIREKTELHSWLYGVPEIILALCSIAIIAEFALGHIIVYENGAAAAVNDVPIYITLIQIAVFLYLPFVPLSKRKNLSVNGVILLSGLVFLPIFSTIIFICTGIGCTPIVSAITVSLLFNNRQREDKIRQTAELTRQEILAEKYSHVLALEDNFESLYDVTLESGYYTSYVKGEFYQNTVMDKLVEPTDYFEDLRANIDAVIYPEDRERLYNTLTRESITRELSSGEHFDFYYRINAENGPLWFKIRIVYKDAQKKNVIIGVFNTEEEIKAKHLVDVERTVNMITSLSDFDPIIVLDPISGEYDWFQSRAQEIEELTSMSIHGENLYKNIGIDSATIIHEDDREQFRAFYTRENMMKVAETGEIQEIENRWRVGPNNTYLWKYNKAVRMTDESGKAVVVVGVTDTTAMKEKERQLQEANDNLSEANRRNELLHRAVQAGVWSYNINAQDEVVSAYYDNYVEQETVLRNIGAPMSWVNSLYPEDRERVLSEFMAAIHDHSGNTPFETTYRLMAQDGKCLWVKTSGRLNHHEDGTAELYGISVDITKQMEEEHEQQQLLETARAAAEVANRAKSSFLFNMSHDIRTPMNAITGFTTMAKKNAGDEKKVVEYLDKIDISGQQLLTLVNQVLEMARIESGKVVFDEKPVSIQEEFNSMVTVLAEQAAVKGLNFKYSLDDLVHDRILADEARMSSITLNIAGNAMKYTPDGGNVEFYLKEIQARKPGYATYVFTVADTGIGMSKEYLKELYEPFSRAKSSTVSKIQGTGLGMSIVKNIIDLMGGKIEVQSELGKGTRFDITVDLKIDAGAEKAVREEEIVPISLKGLRVLLVEDNEMNREIARDILEEQGLIVEDAEDGDIAVAMVKAIAERGEFHYYDFILMDVQMPRMNGFEATKAIRDIPGPAGVHIPIIAMTANAFEEDRQNALKAGMDEHLAKPIDVQKMLITISKLLQS